VTARARGGWLAFAMVAIWMLVLNPVRLDQTVHAGGLSMKVPFLWTPMQVAGKEMPVALRREWAPFLPAGSVNVMDLAELGSKNGPWTMESARRAQADLVSFPSRDSRLSNPQSFDLKAGDHTAVCVESTAGDDDRLLVCYIVGTPLQFSFDGSRFSEPAARRMLASLS